MRTRILAVMTAALAGCSGADGGVGLEVRATRAGLAAGEPLEVQDAGGSTVVITEARIAVKEIRLELPAGTRCTDVEAEVGGGAECKGEDEAEEHDDSDEEILVRGPFVVDLVTGASTPDLSAVRVPDLPYDEVEIRLEESGQLDGASWVMSGTVDGQPLSVRLKFDEDIEIEQPGGVRVVEGAPLLVEFDTSRWFEALSLSSCVADGAVTIDDEGEDTCDIEDQLEDALDGSAELDRDDDGGEDEPEDD